MLCEFEFVGNLINGLNTMELKKGLYGIYEMPTFAVGCEKPYISEYDKEKNCFLVSLNVSVSRWYPEDVFRKLLERIEISDIDSTLKELKSKLQKGDVEKSDSPMYTEKCHFKCETHFIECELGNTSK